MLERNEIQIIHSELSNVIKIVSSITDLLSRRDARHVSDENTKDALQDHIMFLETQGTKLQDENKDLKSTNVTLNVQLTKIKERERLQVLEIEKLIDERDDALNRLEEAENLFKGIFSREKTVSRASTPNRDGRRESGSVKGKQTGKRVSWSSSSAPAVSVTPSTPSSSDAPTPILSERTFKTRSSTSSVTTSSRKSKPPSSGSRAFGFHLADSEQSEREWYIETEKLPATASDNRGPFEFADLAEKLEMTGGEVIRLEKRIIASAKLGPRVYFHKNLLFVFDPMWLELKEHTCLIDWSDSKAHEETKEYVGRKTKSSALFHIFSFPLPKNGWFYLGPHKLQWTELLELWPQLTPDEKESCVTKMNIRTKIKEEELLKLEMTQTTIEVWNASNGDNVAAFVKKHRL